jgi:glycosyltransferase involved in cell wall biosynthesis
MSTILYLGLYHRHDDPRLFYRQMRALHARNPELRFCFLGNDRGPVASSAAGLIRDGGIELEIRLLPQGDGRLGRILTWPKRAIRGLLVARTVRPSVVQASDAREIVAALAMAAVTRATPIFDSHEDYFRQAYEYGRKRPLALLRGLILRTQELVLLRFFAAVFCTDDSLFERYAKRRYGLRNLHLLRNLPFIPEAAPRDHLRGSTSELKLVYIGSVNEHRGVRECAEYVRRFNAAFMPARRLSLTVCGPQHPIVRELEAAGSVTHRPWVAYPAVMAGLAEFDVGVCLLLPITKYERNVPIKNFDYMAAGLPVLTSNFGNVGRYLELSGGGIAIDPTSYEDFERAIVRLFDPVVRQELAAGGRKFIEATGGFGRESEAYVEVIEGAVARSRAAAASRHSRRPLWRQPAPGECAPGADKGARGRSGGRGGKG